MMMIMIEGEYVRGRRQSRERGAIRIEGTLDEVKIKKGEGRQKKGAKREKEEGGEN